jgi:hypothetical protein
MGFATTYNFILLWATREVTGKAPQNDENPNKNNTENPISIGPIRYCPPPCHRKPSDRIDSRDPLQV